MAGYKKVNANIEEVNRLLDEATPKENEEVFTSCEKCRKVLLLGIDATKVPTEDGNIFLCENCLLLTDEKNSSHL